MGGCLIFLNVFMFAPNTSESQDTAPKTSSEDGIPPHQVSTLNFDSPIQQFPESNGARLLRSVGPIVFSSSIQFIDFSAE
jgi:hypothetical protein